MNRPTPSFGFTLVELLVALVLGLLVIAAAGAIFLGGSRTYREDERMAQMHDNVRFALAGLTAEIEMAGHWSDMFSAPETVDPVTLGGPPAPGDCGRAGTPWRFDTTPSLEVVDNHNPSSTDVTRNAALAFSCLKSDEVVAGTDVVAVKHVAGSPSTVLDGGRVYLKTNNVNGIIFRHDPKTPPDTTPVLGATQDWAYEISVFYIRPYLVDEADKIPSLCRKTLQGLAVEGDGGCLAGIENLQVEAGVDAGRDGVPDRYTSAPTTADFPGIVTFRISMLARTEKPLSGYVNPKTYTFANVAAYTPKDPHPRELSTAVVALRNPAATRQFLR